MAEIIQILSCLISFFDTETLQSQIFHVHQAHFQRTSPSNDTDHCITFTSGYQMCKNRTRILPLLPHQLHLTHIFNTTYILNSNSVTALDSTDIRPDDRTTNVACTCTVKTQCRSKMDEVSEISGRTRLLQVLRLTPVWFDRRRQQSSDR